MNQYVKDTLITYHSKSHIIKAVKYEEGMEDDWAIRIDGYGYVQKIFKSKKKADKYIKNHKDDGMEYFDPVPVFINEISEHDYEESYVEEYGYSMDVIRHKGKLYAYDEFYPYGSECYIIVEDGSTSCFPRYEYGEDFLKKYEKGDIKMEIPDIKAEEDIQHKFRQQLISTNELDSDTIETVMQTFDEVAARYVFTRK